MAELNQVATPQLQTVVLAIIGLVILAYFVLLIRRFGDYTLRTKLIISFLTITLITVGTITFFTTRATASALTVEVGNNLNNLAVSQSLAIGDLLGGQVNALQSLSINSTLQEGTGDQNLEFNVASSGDRELIIARIKETDDEWLQAAEDDLLVSSHLGNASATELRTFQSLFPGHEELFTTDRFGALVAATNRTSDYYQGDEQWWQSAYNEGKGAIYIGQPEWDESSQSFGLFMALPIYNNNNEISGILRSTYDLSILNGLITEVGEGQTTTDILLPNGQILEIAENSSRPLTEEAGAALEAAASQPFVELTFAGRESLVSQASVTDITGSALVSDLNWRVIVHQEREAALGPVRAQQRASLIVVVVIAGAAALVAIWLAQVLTNPISQLTEVAAQVAAGDLSVKAKIHSDDEIGLIAQNFNKMTEELQATLTKLEERVAMRTRDLALAAEIGRTISEVIIELDLLLTNSVYLIQENFGLYSTQIYLTDESQNKLILRAATGVAGEELLARQYSLPINRNSTNGNAALDQKVVIVADVENSDIFRPNPQLPATRSEMAIPLLIGDRVVGILNVQSDEPQALTSDVLPAFDVLAGQLAIAIENAGLIEEIQGAQAELEAQARQLTHEGWKNYLDGIRHNEKIGYTYEQGKVDRASEQDVESYQMATPIRIVGESIGGIYLSDQDGRWDEETGQLLNIVAEQVAQRIENLRLLAEADRYRAEAEAATRRLIREGWKSYQAGKADLPEGFVYDQQKVKPIARGEDSDTSTLLSKALAVGGEAIGQLAVDTTGGDGETAEFIGAVANQLSSHIENLRLNEQTYQALAEAQRRSEELSYINRVVSAVAASLDLEESLSIICDELADALNVKQVRIAILNDERTHLRVVAEHYDPAISESAFGVVLPLEGYDLTQQVIETSEAVIVPDAQTDPLTEPVRELFRQQGIHSLAMLPILSGDEVIGTVGIDILDANRTINEEQVNLANTIILQASTAIANSRLFEQLQTVLRNTEEQAQRLAALNELSDQFNRDNNAQEIYDLLITKTSNVLDYELLILTTVDKEKELVTVVATDDKIGASIEVGVPIPFSDTPLERIVKQTHPEVTIIDAPEASLHESVASVMIVPLASSRGIVGTLNVASQTEDAYDSQDESLALQLANLVSSTLENRRLFDEARTRAEELAAINRVAQAVSHQLDRDQLLNTIYQQVKRVLNVDTFFVGIHHEASDQIEFPLVYEKGNPYTEAPRPLDPDSYSCTVIRSSQPVLVRLTPEEVKIEEEKTEARITEGSHQHVGGGKTDIPPSAIYVPLKVGARVTGVLAIMTYDYDVYDETDQTLLEGIANHVALALENARLFEQTQQRARRERLVNQITQEIQKTRTVEEALQTAVRELGNAFHAKYAEVQVTIETQATNGSSDGADGADGAGE